ncbi:MAG: hypothetical protein HLUCCO07_10125 [Rhodobacteraceae bacterium HLUCCO07]|nr:MAG: hypothetical protein HLUCCO07_10125 [Rhodobacteraceae bacterium HLUCCO07]
MPATSSASLALAARLRDLDDAEAAAIEHFGLRRVTADEVAELAQLFTVLPPPPPPPPPGA